MRIPYFDPIGPFQKSTPLERGDWFVPTRGVDECAEKESHKKTGLHVLKIVVTVLALAAFLVLGAIVIADDFVTPSSPGPLEGSTFFR